MDLPTIVELTRCASGAAEQARIETLTPEAAKGQIDGLWWSGLASTLDLGRQAYWLLKMNADKVALKFRQSDLAAMDDNTKRQLIADIQRALGVAPFKKAVL